MLTADILRLRRMAIRRYRLCCSEFAKKAFRSWNQKGTFNLLPLSWIAAERNHFPISYQQAMWEGGREGDRSRANLSQWVEEEEEKGSNGDRGNSWYGGGRIEEEEENYGRSSIGAKKNGDDFIGESFAVTN